jgi:hypothetical protein
MLRGPRAVIAAVSAIAALAVITTGCGGGSSGGAKGALPLDPVAAAATKTQHAGAARVRFSVAMSGSKLGKSTLRMRGVGAIDGPSSEMSFRLGSMLGEMGAPAGVLNKLGQSSIKAITLEQNGDLVIYLHLGFLSSQIPGGKPWIKLDFSKLGKQAGIDFGSLFSGNQLGPSDLLAMLKTEGAQVHKIGAAGVGGVSTTHYHFTVDLGKALESKGVSSPMLKTLAARMKTASDDVWVSKDGLVRRIRTAYTMAGLPGAPHMAMTMDIYDYGAQITIAAPPSSEVFDGTQLAQQGISSSLP